MPGSTLSASGSAQELVTALLDRLTLQSSSLRQTRSEFSIDEVSLTSHLEHTLLSSQQLDRLHMSINCVSRSLSTIRNAFAPVNTLPSEVLANVFGMLACSVNTPRPFLPDLEVCREPYAWIVVTHVCRYWRETAFSFPALWSTIDSYSTLTSLAFLDRSAAADARVYLRDAVSSVGVSPCLDRGRFMQAIAYHSGRIEELHLQPAFKYGPMILQSFHYPAPKLRALTVMLRLHQEVPHELPLLFDGYIPNLEKLTLANFSQWPLHQFGTKLTHLCLMDQPHRGRMSLDRFMDFLATCEALEELVLVDAGPTVFDASPGLGNSDGKFALLKHLRQLDIGDWPTPQSVARFLGQLILPPSTKIFIWADCMFRTHETFSTLLPPDLQHLHPLHHLKAFHITYRPARGDYPQLLSIQDGVLVCYLHFAMSTTVEMFQSVFSQIDLQHVEVLTLGIRSNPEMPEATWRDIFTMMPRVHTLNVVRRPSRPILAALGTEAFDDDDEVLCPALTLLTITDDRAVSSICLFLFAEERAQRGIPLRQLQLGSKTNMYSSCLDEEMDDLRSQIAEVEYVEDEVVDVRKLPAGWPTATYRWQLNIRQGRTRPLQMA
ncbi:hypothetical protein BC835DRAFT_1420392 [Cytidiella melzeri]|nr:hypothetical protein BC835DRAFT_1420392 [Cytidiella melzeri]